VTRGNSGTALLEPVVHTELEPRAEVTDGYSAALNGPFNTFQLTRIYDALAAADTETGLTFSVYVGPIQIKSQLDESFQDTMTARELHAKLPNAANAVLIAVSPNQRVIEIVTGTLSRKRLNDQSCAIVTLSAASSFTLGDLTGGIVTALRMLTDRASL
jgi:hypothetical protein